MSCLIIGDHTQGLGILRSLSGNSITTHVINDKHISLSRFSRYLKAYHFVKRHTLKDLYHSGNSARLLRFISNLVPHGQRWVVFGINEDTINFLYKNKEVLDRKLCIPDNDINRIIDKFRFSAEIEKIGLLSPKTYLLTNFDQTLLNQNTYVCKGRIGNKFRNISNMKGMDITTTEDVFWLKEYIDGVLDEDEVLLQKKVRNNKKVLHCCGLAINGRIFNRFQYVKLRQHPDEFGTGTFLKSISNNDIFDQTASIIRHFYYTGIFEIEYIQNVDGNYYVIEMNPRTWKSINFATDCGCNICAAYYAYMKHSRAPEKYFSHAVGKTWVDLGTDIPMFIKERQFKHAGYSKDTFFCVLNRRDPLPFIMEILLAPLILKKA